MTDVLLDSFNRFVQWTGAASRTKTTLLMGLVHIVQINTFPLRPQESGTPLGARVKWRLRREKPSEHRRVAFQKWHPRRS